jgi:cell division protein FtsB
MYRLREWLRRELLTLILGTALAVVCLNLARASHGLRDLFVLRQYRERLESGLERQQAEDRNLQATITKLQSDDAYIQRLIRQQLGFARSNELIYKFPGDSVPPSQPTP